MKGKACIIDKNKVIVHKGKIELYPYEENLYFSQFKYKDKIRNRIWVKNVCSTCGKDTFQDRVNHQRSNRCFCSKECKLIAFSGENNSNWGGGRKIKDKKKLKSHILVYAPNHPNKNRDGYVPEHRIVVEKNIGRYLNKNELVHHIDCDPSNNKLENLVIVSQKEHNNIHWGLNNLIPTLLDKGVIYFNRQTMRYELI